MRQPGTRDSDWWSEVKQSEGLTKNNYFDSIDRKEYRHSSMSWNIEYKNGYHEYRTILTWPSTFDRM